MGGIVKYRGEPRFCSNCKNLMYPEKTPMGLVFKCKHCGMEVLVAENGEQVIKPPIPKHYSETLEVEEHTVPFYYLGYYIPKKRGYQDEFSQKVLKFKQGDFFAVSEFVKRIIDLIKSLDLDIDMIVPIPGSSKGKIGRGHRQLASEISRALGIKNGTGVLVRISSVRSSHQAKSSEERPTEIHHLFSIRCIEDVNDMKILLFDDILTTGATARACIKKLLWCGASKVYLITLAKTRGW